MLKIIQAALGWLDRDGGALVVGFVLGVLLTMRFQKHFCYYQDWVEEFRREVRRKKKGGEQ